MHIYEGAAITLHGYEMVVKNLTQAYGHNGSEYLWFIRFEGHCTSNTCNDDIRDTEYDGGVYGGNHLAGYRWDINVPIVGNTHNILDRKPLARA